MTKYSIVAILYISIQIISILLLIILIYSLLKSESHFTKWTLFQLFISAFGNGLSGLPPIMYYGDDLINRAFETPICLISNKVSSLTLYPTEFFPLFITFYLWHDLKNINKNKKVDIEKKCFWWASISVWLFTIAFNIFDTFMSINEENFGVVVTSLSCKKSKNRSNFYVYAIPTASLSLVAFIMTCHSSIILYKQWNFFKNNKNRSTAIYLGRSVRLYMLCIVYITFLSSTLIPRIINHFKSSNDSIPNPSFLVGSFMGILPGILLFLIFGAKKHAAIFLPFSFCYYVPPGKPTRCPDNSSINTISTENDGSSSSSTTTKQDNNESIQLEIIKDNSSTARDDNESLKIEILDTVVNK